MLRESAKGQDSAHAFLLLQEQGVMVLGEIHSTNEAEFVFWRCQLIREQVQLPVRKADSH